MSRVKKSNIIPAGLLLACVSLVAIGGVSHYTASAANNTMVSVTVEAQQAHFAIAMTQPKSGSTVTKATGILKVDYTDAAQLVITLTPVGGGAPITIYNGSPSPTSGTLSLAYNLPDYGEYVVSYTGTDTETAPQAGSLGNFFYKSVYVTPVDKDGNPVDPDAVTDDTGYRVSFDDDVETIIIDDGHGNVVEHDLTADDKANGYVDIPLPNLPVGDSTLTVTGEDGTGAQVGDDFILDVTKIPTPPATGFSKITQDIAASDYSFLLITATSLIILSFVMFAARRRKNAQK